MLAQEQNYRIIPDPNAPKRWAYQIVRNTTIIKTVGGFKTSNDAKRAYDRARKTSST